MTADFTVRPGETEIKPVHDNVRESRNRFWARNNDGTGDDARPH